jgi:hypothetical protein
MRSFCLIKVSLLVFVFSHFGCTTGGNNYALGGFAGGATIGAVAGSGSGNAGSGALIGAGAGLVTGAAFDVYDVTKLSNISDNYDIIKENDLLINKRQAEIAHLRQSVEAETAEIDPDRVQGHYRYQGPSLGNSFR